VIAPEPGRLDLLTSLAAIRCDASPETVHTIRTSAARLRVWLAMGGRRVLDDDLRWLRTSAAPVREVQAVRRRDLPASLDAWLAGELETRIADMRRTLTGGRFDGIRDALPLLAPLPATTRNAHCPRSNATSPIAPGV
jgi:hypothetical protein